MPTYQPGIPTGFIPLNQDYLNLQGNFTSLNDQFLVDHVPLDSASVTSPNGYHESIHFVPQSTTSDTSNPPTNYPPTTPPVTAGYGQLFSAQVNDGISTDTALYWLTGGGILTELTRNLLPVVAQNGYTYLPGGIIIQWARFSPTTNSSPPNITFPISFPNNCFVVILQGDDNTSATQNLLVTERTKTNFSYKSLNSPGTFYTYVALGN
jgi:hypothetical protein